MKFTIEQHELIEPLRKLAGVVPGSDLVSAMSSILLEPASNGVTFTATDNNLRLTFRVPVEGTELVPCTMPASKLLQICSKFPADSSIQFEFDPKESTMTFRHKRSRYVVKTDDPDKFPSMSAQEDTAQLQIPEGVLLSLLSRVRYAAAKNDMRYYLMGVLLDVHPDHIAAVATDGHRMSVAVNTLETGLEQPRQLILPNKGVEELVRILAPLEDPVTLHLADNHMRLDQAGENTGFQTILVDGKYPDYQSVVPKDRESIANVGRQELILAAERLAAISDVKMKGVKLSFAQELTVSTENSAGDSGEEVFELEYGGEPIEIALNIDYLLDALRNQESDKVAFGLKDGLTSILITAVDGESEGDKHIIMPLRS